LSFDAVLDVQPWACNPTLLYAALNMQRFPVKSLPPINSCIGLRSARGDRVVALIQDTVATFIPKEVQVGDALRVYAMNIYFDNRRKLPVFLVNEFQTKSQPK
jgi:hypothetical protein